MESGLISFTNYSKNIYKTIVKMSSKRTAELSKNGFHLFPDK